MGEQGVGRVPDGTGLSSPTEPQSSQSDHLSIEHGDAIFSSTMRDERPFGWRSFRAPKGKRFVFLLLGTVDKDATNFDVDAALEGLGWRFPDPLP